MAVVRETMRGMSLATGRSKMDLMNFWFIWLRRGATLTAPALMVRLRVSPALRGEGVGAVLTLSVVDDDTRDPSGINDELLPTRLGVGYGAPPDPYAVAGERGGLRRGELPRRSRACLVSSVMISGGTILVSPDSNGWLSTLGGPYECHRNAKRAENPSPSRNAPKQVHFRATVVHQEAGNHKKQSVTRSATQREQIGMGDSASKACSKEHLRLAGTESQILVSNPANASTYPKEATLTGTHSSDSRNGAARRVYRH